MKTMTRISGVIFLVIGALWISSIYVRCHGYPSREEARVSDLLEESAGSVQGGENLSETRLKKFRVREFLSAKDEALFWVIAYAELACATLFLLTGIFFLRVYPFRQFLFMAMMASDIILKLLIVVYQWSVIFPLRDVFKETNLLGVHFVPDKTFPSIVSSYLTGVRLIQSGALYYVFAYSAFWGALIFLFVRSRAESGINNKVRSGQLFRKQTCR